MAISRRFSSSRGNSASSARQRFTRREDGGRLAPRPRWLSLWSGVETLRTGTTLFDIGCVPRDVFFIEDGVAQLVRVGEDNDPVIVGLRFPGWFVGAESAMLNEPAPFSARALTQCHVYRAGRDAFLRQLTTDPGLSNRINQLHSREVIEGLRSRDVLSPYQRLQEFCRQLINANEASPLKKTIRLKLPIDDDELAGLLGISTGQLNLLLGQLDRQDHVRIADGVMEISNLHRLKTAHHIDVGWPLNAIGFTRASARERARSQSPRVSLRRSALIRGN
jgi:CRP-like cAMP-binding protein